jgi:endonuclease/exonuclease/phosphatase (EEP) superfamily protein YafD
VTVTHRSEVTRPTKDARSWDSPRPVRGSIFALSALGTAFALPGLVTTYLRLEPPSDDATALVAAFIPYGILAYAASLCCFVAAAIAARFRLPLIMIVVGLCALLGVHTRWLAPFFVADHRPATTRTFTLLSQNLYAGRADPTALVAQAQQADVVVLLEATPDSLRALQAAGLSRRLPYAVGAPQQGVSNTAIYSRFPLTDARLVGGTLFQQYVATVRLPDLGPVRLIAAHACNPYCGGGHWANDHVILRATADAYLTQPLVMAGDLNAVDDHGPLQALRRDGLESATDIAGAGWLPTYPANKVLPPLLPIDHVLLNDKLTATSIHTIKVPGTDHLGLVATIAGTG